MWKTIHRSVVGTSHELAGVACQDCSGVREVECGGARILIAVCSDGAGSAKHAERGSTLICSKFLELVEADLLAGLTTEQLTRETVVNWCVRLRQALQETATQLECELRDLASTFLGAVLLPTSSWLMQIGDGAIVLQHGERYEVVFWPQSGEYVNTTNFLTDEQFDARFEFVSRDGEPPTALAMFTDGLERLILKAADRSVHVPFLEPLFQSLANHDADQLLEPMQSFLSSQEINDRTEDDKTLVLALRNLATAKPDATA